MYVRGFPSLSVSIASPSETSPESFFLDLKYIKISFCRHLLAYVAKRVPFVISNESIAFIKPMVPRDMRSSVLVPDEAYFFITCATRRRLCSISFFRASVSPSRAFIKHSVSSSASKGGGKFPEVLTFRKRNMNLPKMPDTDEKTDIIASPIKFILLFQ